MASPPATSARHPGHLHGPGPARVRRPTGGSGERIPDKPPRGGRRGLSGHRDGEGDTRTCEPPHQLAQPLRGSLGRVGIARPPAHPEAVTGLLGERHDRVVRGTAPLLRVVAHLRPGLLASVPHRDRRVKHQGRLLGAPPGSGAQRCRTILQRSSARSGTIRPLAGLSQRPNVVGSDIRTRPKIRRTPRRPGRDRSSITQPP